ncbi:MAG: 8-oxo-dGTP diphosphatase MutT [Cellvibrionaceae bacterium]|nr:8-oxo-dGTP diphosphatase MutT [Cellvibrionaceae bacterium]
MPSIEANLDTTPKPLRVAVGVVKNAAGEILIARRQSGQHLAGLWEFPGGKIEAGESREQALCRELREEVGIAVASCDYLMTINHQYANKYICLEILLVDAFSGSAAGMEGQQIKWIAISELANYAFPEANKAIVDYLVNHSA